MEEIYYQAIVKIASQEPATKGERELIEIAWQALVDSLKFQIAEEILTKTFSDE